MDFDFDWNARFKVRGPNINSELECGFYIGWDIDKLDIPFGQWFTGINFGGRGLCDYFLRFARVLIVGVLWRRDYFLNAR